MIHRVVLFGPEAQTTRNNEGVEPADGGRQQHVGKYVSRRRAPTEEAETSMEGNISNSAGPVGSSLSKLQSLNGLFAINKKQGPTSADVLNMLKETLLKGNTTRAGTRS